MKKILIVLYALMFSSLCFAAEINKIADNAEQVAPLLNGQMLPDVIVSDLDGNSVKIKELVQDKPTVFIFYRGGWCPYCSAQLAGLRDVEKQIIDLGYQIVAISPDSPARLKEQALKSEFAVTLLSDNKFEASSAFGIGFFLPDNLAARYKDKMGVEFASIDGTSKVALPVPAVYVADSEGVIHFQYVNPNFRVRVEPELLLQATKILDLANQS